MLLKRAIESNKYTDVLMGGARGGGKSHGIRELAIKYALEFGFPVMIFRRHREELMANHINPLIRKYPYMSEFLDRQSLSLKHPKTMLPLIQFGYADTDQDIYKYQGHEYPIIFIDEAQQCTEDQLTFLKTSNRDPEERIKPLIVYTANPGGVGHAYLKRIFIDCNYYKNEKKEDYFFIASKVWDNVCWVMKQLKIEGKTIREYYSWTNEQRKKYCLQYSDYANKLSALNETLREAYLEGNWDIYGGMFFKNFQREKIEVPPFKIPKEWNLYLAIDPGFSSPCAAVLAAVDFQNNIYIIETYYEAGRNPSDNATGVREMIDNCVWTNGRNPKQFISGLDAFAKKDRYAIISNEATFADVFIEKKMYLEPAVTNRKQGWWHWKTIIDQERFKIFNYGNMPLINEMIAVICDKKDIDDIQGKGNDPAVIDHALDCTRYLLMSALKPVEKDNNNYPDWYLKKLAKDKANKVNSTSYMSN